MGSTVSACLATPFQIKGVNYSISSACSTSAHCIGNAMELIQLGKQDLVFRFAWVRIGETSPLAFPPGAGSEAGTQTGVQDAQ